MDQFSLSLRYVTKTGISIERFIKFAASFYDLLHNSLTKDLGLNVNDLRGQAYDGARMMSGQLTGLQARVKQNCSDKAFYVHCCAHNLNLILMDAACCLCSAKDFFCTLENLCCFLTSSLPRFKILEEEQEIMQLERTILTLKSLSDTRWASRKQATEAVIQSLPAILKALSRIQHHHNSTAMVASEADRLLSKLSTFEFMFVLVFCNDLLERTNILSNYLQK